MPDVLPRKDNPPLQREAKAFAKDERGAILILWALFLAVAFGFLALAFDLGRIATTQSQLQSFADQVALAAAGELDGRQDSITRAEEAVFGNGAVGGLIAGQQTYGLGSQALGAQDITLTFYSSLPPDDRADPSPFLTTNPRLARFVRADIANRTVLTPFAAVNAALNGRTQVSADIGASATAGFTAYACDITPLFFCVPNASWRAQANIGIQIEAVSGSSGNALWSAGNFGFLDPSVLPVDPTGPCRNLNGAQLYRCLVGAERGITQCIDVNRPLETRPGQAQGLTEAFNARFDIFQGSMGQYSNRDNYRPAPNVLSDLWSEGGGSSAPTPTNLPKDPCIAAQSCRFGDGNWDRDGYLATYHGGQWPIANDPNAAQRPVRASAKRYDIYLAEIDAARARGDAGMPTAAGYGNMGRPGNHSSAQTAAERATLDPARRTVIAAAVECAGQSMNGRSDVTPLEYVRLFMTEPVRGSGNDSRILAEVVGSVGGIGSGAQEASFQDFIQLYR